MSKGTKHVKLVEWSDTDNCYIGSCPELFYDGCHGDDEHKVFDDLCRIVEATIVLYNEDGKTLPKPLTNKEFVNALQGIG